jgi:hypothetical protein
MGNLVEAFTQGRRDWLASSSVAKAERGVGRVTVDPKIKHTILPAAPKIKHTILPAADPFQKDSGEWQP